MLNISKTRNNPSSLTSKEAQDQQIEQLLTESLPDNYDQLSKEQLVQHQQQMLKAYFLGQSHALSETKQMQAQNEQLILSLTKKFENFEAGELERDRQMQREMGLIRRVVMFTKNQVKDIKFSVKKIHRIIQPSLAGLVFWQFCGDIILKEVVKKCIGDEWYEGMAKCIDLMSKPIEPFMNLYWKGMQVYFPALSQKTATIVLIAAVSLTVYAIQAFREGRNKDSK